jgi:leucyl-tRNA synthetase
MSAVAAARWKPMSRPPRNAVARTGYSVLPPDSRQADPMWVANYVLMSYGEGAVMGVPAHDERDFEFAHGHGLALKEVVRAAGAGHEPQGATWQASYGERGVTFDSGEFSGLDFTAAVDAIAAALEQRQLGPQARAMAASRLGHLAPALLGLPDPADPLRALRHGAGARMSSCRWCCPRG